MKLKIIINVTIPRPLTVEAVLNYLRHRFGGAVVQVPVYGQETQGPLVIEVEEVKINDQQ